MEFSRQEHWRRLLFLTPGDLPDPGIKLESLASTALAGRFFTTVPPGKPHWGSTNLLLEQMWVKLSYITRSPHTHKLTYNDLLIYLGITS